MRRDMKEESGEPLDEATSMMTMTTTTTMIIEIGTAAELG